MTRNQRVYARGVMVRTRFVLLAVASLLVAGLAIFFLARNWAPQPPPTIPDGKAVKPLIVEQGMDVVLQELADRTAKQLGGANDLQVVVTRIAVPIGALLEKGRSLPDDDVSCRVKPEPEAYPMPSTFPDFHISAATAAEFGLDEALATVGVSTTSDRSMVMSFKQPGFVALTGAGMRELMTRAACAQALSGRDMLMVRGYVTGKRSLVLSDKRANEIRGDAKVSSFKLSPTGDSSISIVDDEPQRFLQIVSEIRAPASSAAKVAEDAAIGKPTAPAAQVVGRIFVQQDWRDDPANGAKVVELLRQHDLLVVAKVERIPSQKMPSTPQVRYFNVADLGMAQRVAGFLEGADLKVRVVRIALPSPSGQLEVWLRKIGS